jgi:hypothetical protein
MDGDGDPGRRAHHGDIPRHDRKALPAFCDSPVPSVGATAVRARASLDRCPVLSTLGGLDQVAPPDLFLLARFSCGFHVDTKTVIYLRRGIVVSTCFWRRERDSNPRRAFDPYTLSRDRKLPLV